MNFNILKFRLIIIISVPLIVFLNNCGNWGWEEVESNHESVLNVFGLISLDSTTQSFAQVYQTINLQDEESKFIRRDTIWYGNSPYDYYLEDVDVSSFLVRDAKVIISDGEIQYHFYPVITKNSHGYYRDGQYVAYSNETTIYLDTLNIFYPQPNTTYYLEVTAPDGRHLTGEVTTPLIPDIHEADIPDTIHVHKPFEITWNSLGNAYARIRTQTYICGGSQEKIIDTGDTTWVLKIPDCPYYETDTAVEMVIELHAIDENYYEYFVKKSIDDEFLNFLLGSSNTRESCGIEGGYGVFGAIAIDKVYRLAMP